jgi:GNAT superfamily N-acetyltransferase
MQKVNFERAAVADAKAYSYVQMKSFGKISKGKLAKTYFSETLNSMMIRNSECYKIITEEFAIIGGIVICPHGETCLIKRLFILPEYQRQGYGKLAVAFAENKYMCIKKWFANIDINFLESSSFFIDLGYKIIKHDKSLCYLAKLID